MNDFDPLKDAFAKRSSAAHNLDIEGGLAGVHRHNAPGRRMAKAGGALMVGLIALGGAGVALSGGGDEIRTDDVADTVPVVTSTVPGVVTPDVDPVDDSVSTTVPTSETVTPTTTPVGEDVTSAPPAIIVTDGSNNVTVDGVTYDMGVGPVTDAIDYAGGLIFETTTGIWHFPANALAPVQVVESWEYSINLLEVAVDAQNADFTVFYTQYEDSAASPMQGLYKLALGSDEGPIRLARVGGGEYAATDGGVGGQAAEDSLIVLAGSDGPCTALKTYNGTTGQELSSEARCVPEGNGTFDVDELYRAVDLTHDGFVVWADANDLVAGSKTIPVAPGPTKFIDVFGEWAVVAVTENEAAVSLVHLPSGVAFDAPAVPAGLTSARPLRSTVELAEAPDFEPFTVVSDNFVVINVADDDVLNIRSGPGTQYAIRGGIPNGDIVTTSGNAARLSSGAEWYEIDINGQATGWLNARFLEILDGDVGEDECLVDDANPANHLLPQTSAAQSSDVDHVSSMTQITLGGGCVRTAIEFGIDFDFEDSGPTGSLPGGITVQSSTDGNSILVELPTTVRQAPIDGVRAGTALMTGPALEILSGPHGAAAFFDTANNVLVVDYVALPVRPDQLPVPLRDEAGVIVRSIDGYSNGPVGAEISGVARVRGFARPFEGTLVVELRGSDGELVEDVLWNNGRDNEATGSGWFPDLVNWMVWGEFDFTFEDLAAGDYTLRLSNDAGAADDPTWFTLPFSVR